MKIEYLGQYQTGGELYRSIIYALDSQGRLIREFEIWFTHEVVEDHLHIKKSPTESELYRFATETFARWTHSNEPKFSGLFVSNKGKFEGNPQFWPGALKGADPVKKTAISLPESLLRWSKLEASKQRVSFSEIIRKALVQFKNQHDGS